MLQTGNNINKSQTQRIRNFFQSGQYTGEIYMRNKFCWSNLCAAKSLGVNIVTKKKKIKIPQDMLHFGYDLSNTIYIANEWF